MSRTLEGLSTTRCLCGCDEPLRAETVRRRRQYKIGHANRVIGGRRLTMAERLRRAYLRHTAARQSGPTVACGCGCGQPIPRVTSDRKLARFVHGHHLRLIGPTARAKALQIVWKGGTSFLPYGPEFNRALKRRILERDVHRCRRCGRTAQEAGSDRALDVHHLDHNKKNNDPSNLVASCRRCNGWASAHRDEPFGTPLAEAI